MTSPVPSPTESFITHQGVRVFLMGAASILAATGVAKFIAVLGDARVLDRPDSVFSFLTNRQLLFAVAVLELSMAAVIVSRWLHVTGKLALTAWLGTTFLAYRIAAGWAGHSGPCGCLGNITDALGVTPATADLAMKIALGYLLAGSVTFLFLLLKRGWGNGRHGGHPATSGRQLDLYGPNSRTRAQ